MKHIPIRVVMFWDAAMIPVSNGRQEPPFIRIPITKQGAIIERKSKEFGTNGWTKNALVAHIRVRKMHFVNDRKLIV